MGVTIHFEGKLKDEHSLAAALALAAEFSKEHGWPVQLIDEMQMTLRRVRDEQDWDYVGPVNGLEIQPHENAEAFRLEFDGDLYLQQYTKTQFAPIEIHMQLAELLCSLKPFFEELKVEDEGGYFDSGDPTLLANHRDRCFEVLDECLAQDSTLSGPVRVRDGRIIDLCKRG